MLRDHAVFFVNFLMPFLIVTSSDEMQKRNSLNGGSHVTSRVYCETETFNATCDVGDVILITHAKYGRMQLNRCVKQDYGHVGCASDVIELADARCSGRRTCEIAIPDSLFSRTKPCPDDLKPYLEVGYNCVPVQIPSTVKCSAAGAVSGDKEASDVPSTAVKSLPVGYFSSHVTLDEETMTAESCEGDEVTGSEVVAVQQAWSIQAQEGQTIQVRLYDFNVLRVSSAVIYVDHHCKVYAVLSETLVTGVRNVTVCGGTSRDRPVYTSVTSRLDVIIYPSSLLTPFSPSPLSSPPVLTDVQQLPYFLLEYRVVGCAEVTPISNAWLRRNQDHLVIKCNSTRQEFYLKCVGNRWVGDVANCSAPVGYSPGAYDLIRNADVTLSFGVYIVIVTMTSTLMGLAVLGGGLTILKRRRIRCSLFPRKSTSQQTSPVSAALDKRYHGYNEVDDDDWTLTSSAPRHGQSQNKQSAATSCRFVCRFWNIRAVDNYITNQHQILSPSTGLARVPLCEPNQAAPASSGTAMDVLYGTRAMPSATTSGTAEHKILLSLATEGNSDVVITNKANKVAGEHAKQDRPVIYSTSGHARRVSDVTRDVTSNDAIFKNGGRLEFSNLNCFMANSSVDISHGKCNDSDYRSKRLNENNMVEYHRHSHHHPRRPSSRDTIGRVGVGPEVVIVKDELEKAQRLKNVKHIDLVECHRAQLANPSSSSSSSSHFSPSLASECRPLVCRGGRHDEDETGSACEEDDVGGRSGHQTNNRDSLVQMFSIQAQ